VSSRSLLTQFLDTERDRWSLWLPVGMGTGIAFYFGLTEEPPVWAFALSPITIAAFFLVRQNYKARMLVGALLMCALGFNAAQMETRLVASPMLDRETSVKAVEGRLMLTEVMPEGVRLTLKDLEIGKRDADPEHPDEHPGRPAWSPERTPEKIRIRMKNKDLTDIPPPGSRINLWAQIGPFSEPVMPGATDFRWQSYYKQLGALGWSYSHITTVENAVDDPSWRDHFSLAFEHARITLAQHVYKYLSGDIAAMTATRLNGEQSAISKPVIESMRIAGLAHLLSTSGFHVTIMGLLVYFPLRALFAMIPFLALRYPIKKWAAFGAIASAMGYTFLVGSQAATLRSLLMTGIAMLAVIVDRRSALMRLVMLSAALVMLIEPHALLGPSFQMSFAAVLCLIARHERFFKDEVENEKPPARFSTWVRAPVRYVWSIVQTSLIATAATTPFAAYHFGTFSFYGFIANTVAIPITSFWVMPCILMAYVTAPFGLDGWFLRGSGIGIDWTIRIAVEVASWPYSLLHIAAMPAVSLTVITLGGLWICLWRQKWRWLGLLPVLCGGLYPLYTFYPDILVSPDGKEWAARLDDGRLAVADLRHNDFVTTQWQEKLGMVELVDVRDLSDEEQQVRCDAMGCVYHHGTHVVAMPKLDAAALEDCEKADIIIAPFVIKNCAAQTIIDDHALWLHGAHTIRFDDDKVLVNFVRERRGLRPWSPGFRWQKRDYIVNTNNIYT
jgi:competence protein ComEC